MGQIETQADCFVCRKHRGEFALPGGAIYEDELVYAGHIKPQEERTYLGWLIVETKRHIPGLAEQTPDEAQATGLLVARLSQALKACTTTEHIYAFVLGDRVPHIHIHLIPRYPGAPQEYWGVRVDEWPEAPRGDMEEIATLCERLRIYLQG